MPTEELFNGGTSFTVATDILREMPTTPVETDPVTNKSYVVPDELRRFLAELRLLQGVPFGYLVPDAKLLPPESIRFFYLDRTWTDSLVQGALSVGTVNSSDRAELENLHTTVRDEVDEEERNIRVPGGESLQEGPAGIVSGFLLRSRAVSGWPGLHVRAYDEELASDVEIPPETDARRVKVMRMERLAPAVLLVLFDGVPRVVHIEEPRQGVQFGVRPTGQGSNFSAEIPVRRMVAADTPGGVDTGDTVGVPFRPGSPGVIDVAELARRMDVHDEDGEAMDAAGFAWQVIRFPYRQVFGDAPDGSSVSLLDLFHPTVGIDELTVELEEVLDALR